MRPCIDHSLLSPSGHMSKSARKAAEQREYARLFPAGYWDTPTETEQQQRERQRTTDLRYADELEALANRGMSARKLRKEAARLRAKWENA